jgi:hypothetical protein
MLVCSVGNRGAFPSQSGSTPWFDLALLKGRGTRYLSPKKMLQ